jgi:PAS domain S-box-containing protein
MNHPAEEPTRDESDWRSLPRAAKIYVVIVIAAGAYLLVAFFPRTFSHPVLFASVLAFSCLTSAWKVNLPLSLSNGSTLSVSHAADLLSLLLFGPRQAMLIAAAGAWTQCTFNVKRPYPPYCTIFSMAGEAITMQATALAYSWLGGAPGPQPFGSLPRQIVGIVATYFIVNTSIIAAAIALSTCKSLWQVWHDDFLWSAPSFMVAGAAGVVAGVVIERGDYWLGILMLAPVYLTYRTYQVFLGRIEDQRRHIEETRKLHREAVEALGQARRAERALADEKERLSVTLRSIGDGVITTDLHGTVLLINKVAETLTGWTQEEAAGQQLAAVFQNVDLETRERCESPLATGPRSVAALGVGRSTMLVARDLSERPIEQSAAPIRDAAGRTIGMVLAFRDITDAIKVQEERAKASKLASLGLLAGGIAHDFNNILMAIMGNVSMARVTMPLSGPAAGALAEAERACVHARQLTWQLLTFSKGGVPVKKTLPISRVLVDSASLAVRGSNVSCTFNIAPDLWAVHADQGQLVQVFNNLLINAQEAMPHGGVAEIHAENIFEPGLRWEYALRVEPGPYVRISITDTGIGIPPEHLGKIFDPYFSTKQRGSGLGLATSYSIVKNHGGYVSVESKPGHGTTVFVNLPASLNRAVEEPAESLDEPSDAGRRRVLVMDDEESIRTLAVNMLEFLGFDAEVVDTGAAVLERYRVAQKSGRPFDAVILDLVVPGGMGGKETMEQLGEIDPAVNAIVASGYAQDPVMSEFGEYGFKGVIAKPFTLQELSKTLESVVTGRRWSVH